MSHRPITQRPVAQQITRCCIAVAITCMLVMLALTTTGKVQPAAFVSVMSFGTIAAGCGFLVLRSRKGQDR